MEELSADDSRRQEVQNDLHDVFFVVQLFTYPGDYVAESPSIERMAETLDRFAEDILGDSRASICAARKATVSFGPAVEATPDLDRRKAGPALTQQLEDNVQELLDQIRPPADRGFGNEHKQA